MITKIKFIIDRKSIKHNPEILSATYDIVSPDTDETFFRPAAALFHHMSTNHDVTD